MVYFRVFSVTWKSQEHREEKTSPDYFLALSLAARLVVTGKITDSVLEIR